jgi:hypothetical protein
MAISVLSQFGTREGNIENVGAISLRNRSFRSQHSSDYAIANRSYEGFLIGLGEIIKITFCILFQLVIAVFGAEVTDSGCS